MKTILSEPTPMEPSYDYRKFAVLYVDDEEMSLKNFARAFGDQFRILTAVNAQEGLKLLEAHAGEIGVLMTDQRMPGENGVWLLERARQLRPGILRILVTAYSDMDAAIAAVNSGAIHRFISKPWDPPQLEQTLRRAIQFFIVQHDRDRLFQEKMASLHSIMSADRTVSLGLMAAGLSHHIRNAMVSVKTFLDLAPSQMEDEKKDPAKLRNPEFWGEYYQNVQGQLDKINNLLQDLWSASEITPSRHTDQVKLGEVVDAACERTREACERAEIEMVNRIPSDIPTMMVDLPKFHRLFELLIRDEAVSLPPGSRVTFTAELVQEGVREMVHIKVSDNGPGLPTETLRALFDPFTVRTDAPSEFGINLMACFFIVYHHGGMIDADCSEGQGTTFNIRVPLKMTTDVAPERAGDLFQRALLNEALWSRMVSSD
jgi:two-component system probable response regulator PhcQ